MLRNLITGVAAIAALVALAGCSDDPKPASTTSSSSSAAAAATTTSAHQGAPAAPVGGGHPANTVTAPGHATPPKTNPGTSPAGSWDSNGNPVNGGPKGADGSTGNNVTKKYCAQNQDPACPAGSYVGPNAILSPDGSGNYVPCEGTVCTNPNHGAGTNPAENGTAPTTATAPAPTQPAQEDKTGQPCTTGMGVEGTYIRGSEGDWVCQIG